MRSSVEVDNEAAFRVQLQAALRQLDLIVQKLNFGSSTKSKLTAIRADVDRWLKDLAIVPAHINAASSLPASAAFTHMLNSSVPSRGLSESSLTDCMTNAPHSGQCFRDADTTLSVLGSPDASTNNSTLPSSTTEVQVVADCSPRRTDLLDACEMGLTNEATRDRNNAVQRSSNGLSKPNVSVASLIDKANADGVRASPEKSKTSCSDASCVPVQRIAAQSSSLVGGRSIVELADLLQKIFTLSVYDGKKLRPASKNVTRVLMVRCISNITAALQHVVRLSYSLSNQEMYSSMHQKFSSAQHQQQQHHFQEQQQRSCGPSAVHKDLQVITMPLVAQSKGDYTVEEPSPTSVSTEDAEMVSEKNLNVRIGMINGSPDTFSCIAQKGYVDVGSCNAREEVVPRLENTDADSATNDNYNQNKNDSESSGNTRTVIQGDREENRLYTEAVTSQEYAGFAKTATTGSPNSSNFINKVNINNDEDADAAANISSQTHQSRARSALQAQHEYVDTFVILAQDLRQSSLTLRMCLELAVNHVDQTVDSELAFGVNMCVDVLRQLRRELRSFAIFLDRMERQSMLDRTHCRGSASRTLPCCVSASARSVRSRSVDGGTTHIGLTSITETAQSHESDNCVRHASLLPVSASSHSAHSETSQGRMTTHSLHTQPPLASLSCHGVGDAWHAKKRAQQLRRWWRPALCRAVQSVDEVVQPAMRFLVSVAGMREMGSSAAMLSLRQLARDELFQLCEPLLCCSPSRLDAAKKFNHPSLVPSSAAVPKASLGSSTVHTVGSVPYSAMHTDPSASAALATRAASLDSRSDVHSDAKPPHRHRENHRQACIISLSTVQLLLELQCCYDATCLSAIAELCGDDNEGRLIATRIVADGVAHYGANECRVVLCAMLLHDRWSTPLLRGILLCVLSTQLPVLRAGLTSLRSLVHACARKQVAHKVHCEHCNDEEPHVEDGEDVKCDGQEEVQEVDEDACDGVLTEKVGLLYTHGVFGLLESENCPGHIKKTLVRHVIHTFLTRGSSWYDEKPKDSSSGSAQAGGDVPRGPVKDGHDATAIPPNRLSFRQDTAPLLLRLYASSDLDIHAHRVNLIQQLVATLVRVVRCAAVSDLTCDGLALRRLLAKIVEPVSEPVRLLSGYDRSTHVGLSRPVALLSCYPPSTRKVSSVICRGTAQAAIDQSLSSLTEHASGTSGSGVSNQSVKGSALFEGENVYEAEDDEWVAWARASSTRVSSASVTEPSLEVLALYALRRMAELLMPSVSLDDLLAWQQKQQIQQQDDENVTDSDKISNDISKTTTTTRNVSANSSSGCLGISNNRESTQQRCFDLMPRLQNRGDKLEEQRLADIFNNAPLKAVVQLFDIEPAEMNTSAVPHSFARSYDRASLPQPTSAVTRQKINSVVDFLYDLNSSLNGEVVAEFLSSPALLPLQVCAEFMSRLPLTGCGVCEALRELLLQIPLPKEGQRIERILEYFSAAYYEANRVSGIDRHIFPFEDSSSCFVVVVATIMLNTNLHNPNAGTHMPCSSFVSQLKACVKTLHFTDTFAHIIYYQVSHGYLDLGRQVTAKGATGTSLNDCTNDASVAATSTSGNSVHSNNVRSNITTNGSDSSNVHGNRSNISCPPCAPHKSSSDVVMTNMGINALFISATERQRLALAIECQRMLTEVGEMLRFSRHVKGVRVIQNKTHAVRPHRTCRYASCYARSSHALRQYARQNSNTNNNNRSSQHQQQQEKEKDQTESTLRMSSIADKQVAYCCDAQKQDESYCRELWWAAVAHDLLVGVWPSLNAVFARNVEDCCKTIAASASTAYTNASSTTTATAATSNQEKQLLANRLSASKAATPAECVLLQCVHGLKQLLYLCAAHYLPRECEATLSSLMRTCSCASVQRECRGMILTAAASSYALHFSIGCWRSVAALMMACRAENHASLMVQVEAILTRMETWTAHRHVIEKQRASTATLLADRCVTPTHAAADTDHVERACTTRTVLCDGVEMKRSSDVVVCEEAAAVRRSLQGLFSILRDVRPGDARNLSAGLYFASRILDYTVITHDADATSVTPTDDVTVCEHSLASHSNVLNDMSLNHRNKNVPPATAVVTNGTSVGNYINVSDLHCIVLPEFVALIQRHGISEESLRVCTEFVVSILEAMWMRYAFGAASTYPFTSSGARGDGKKNTNSKTYNDSIDTCYEKNFYDCQENDMWVRCYDVFRLCYMQRGSSGQVKLYILQAVKELMARMIHKTRAIHSRYSSSLYVREGGNTPHHPKHSTGSVSVDTAQQGQPYASDAKGSAYGNNHSKDDTSGNSCNNNDATCSRLCIRAAIDVWRRVLSPVALALLTQDGVTTETNSLGVLVLRHLTLLAVGVTVVAGRESGTSAKPTNQSHARGRDDNIPMTSTNVQQHASHSSSAGVVVVNAMNAPMQRVLLVLLSNLAYIGLQCSDIDTAQSCLGPLTTLCTHSFKMTCHSNHGRNAETNSSNKNDDYNNDSDKQLANSRDGRCEGRGGVPMGATTRSDVHLSRAADEEESLRSAFVHVLWGVSRNRASSPVRTDDDYASSTDAPGSNCGADDSHFVAMHILERLCALLRCERDVTRADCLQMLTALVTDLPDRYLHLVARSVSCAILTGVVADTNRQRDSSSSGGGGAVTKEEPFYTQSVYHVAVEMLLLGESPVCGTTTDNRSHVDESHRTASNSRSNDISVSRASATHEPLRARSGNTAITMLAGACVPEEPRYATRHEIQPTLSRAITFLTQNVLAAATPSARMQLMQYIIEHCLLPVIVLSSESTTPRRNASEAEKHTLPSSVAPAQYSIRSSSSRLSKCTTQRMHQYEGIGEDAQLIRCLAARALMQTSSRLLISHHSDSDHPVPITSSIASHIHSTHAEPTNQFTTHASLDRAKTAAHASSLLLCVLDAVSAILSVIAPPHCAVVPPAVHFAGWKWQESCATLSLTTKRQDEEKARLAQEDVICINDKVQVEDDEVRQASCAAGSCLVGDGGYSAQIADYVYAIRCSGDLCLDVMGCGGTLAMRHTAANTITLDKGNCCGCYSLPRSGSETEKDEDYVAVTQSVRATLELEGMSAERQGDEEPYKDDDMVSGGAADVYSSKDHGNNFATTTHATATSTSKKSHSNTIQSDVVDNTNEEESVPVSPARIDALTDMIVLLNNTVSPLPRLLTSVDLLPLIQLVRTNSNCSNYGKNQRHGDVLDNRAGVAVLPVRPPHTTSLHLVHLFLRAASTMFAVMWRLAHPHCIQAWLQPMPAVPSLSPPASGPQRVYDYSGERGVSNGRDNVAHTNDTTRNHAHSYKDTSGAHTTDNRTSSTGNELTALLPHTALRSILSSYFALVVCTREYAVSCVVSDTLELLRVLRAAQRWTGQGEYTQQNSHPESLSRTPSFPPLQQSSVSTSVTRHADNYPTRSSHTRLQCSHAAPHDRAGAGTAASLVLLSDNTHSHEKDSICADRSTDRDIRADVSLHVDSHASPGAQQNYIHVCDRAAEAEARQRQSPLVQQHVRACHVGVYHELSVVLSNWLTYLMQEGRLAQYHNDSHSAPGESNNIARSAQEVDSATPGSGCSSDASARAQREGAAEVENGDNGIATDRAADVSRSHNNTDADINSVRALASQRVRAILTAAAATPKLAMALLELLSPAAGPAVITMVRRYMTWYMEYSNAAARMGDDRGDGEAIAL